MALTRLIQWVAGLLMIFWILTAVFWDQRVMAAQGLGLTGWMPGA